MASYDNIVLVLLSFASVVVSQISVCPLSNYDLQNNGFCYRYVATPTDYFSANRSCIREGGNLVYITSQSENDLVTASYHNGGFDFWIGLTDLDSEGTFRWTNRSVPVVYTNWVGANPSLTNEGNKDCVVLTSTSEWRVHSSLCGTSHLPFLCKTNTCIQSIINPEFCSGAEPTTPPQTGLATEGVVAIVVILLVVIAIISISVSCLLLWKLNNDCFTRYVCPCVGGTKHTSTVHSLQQENERLRKQVSEKRVSMSGHFSHAGELSGVPDGRGGVLPTIKQVSSMITNRPPPLMLSRAYSKPGLTTPTRGLTTPFPMAPMSGNSNRPMRQSAPAFTTQPIKSLVRPPTQPAVIHSEESDSSSEDSDNQLFTDEEGGIKDPRAVSGGVKDPRAVIEGLN